MDDIEPNDLNVFIIPKICLFCAEIFIL